MEPNGHQEKLIVPTLLIGLGGIGSRIVDEVYDRVPHVYRDRIAAHVFDTNVNDLSKLRHLAPAQLTQTSKNQTVGSYIWQSNEAGSPVDTWFPTHHAELQRKLLTEGAGQVRVVSRLAYRAALEEAALTNLTRQISHVFTVRGDGHIVSPRVMIVSSLAGGTGAGLFLQVAMFLRDLLEADFGQNAFLIRGAFLLPDALVRSGILDRTEHEQVRANGYACFKELNALIRQAQARIDPASPDAHLDVELEYDPSKDARLGWRNLPFDFVFLYDYENTQSLNLNAFHHYLEQMTQTILLQLFSPISANFFSAEDNQIRQLVSDAGLSRYCGAGVARLIYPYADVLEYMALRWAGESLKDQWLKIDEEFNEIHTQWKRDQDNGVFYEQPRLDEQYVKLFQQFATGERPDPFYTPLHRTTQVMDERGDPVDDKYRLFIDAIDKEIERVLEQDHDLKQAEVNCTMDERSLETKDRAEDLITTQEYHLRHLQRVVDQAVHEYRTSIANEIVGRDCNRPSNTRGGNHQLNTWMLAKDRPLHPVVVRYVLYQILLELEQRIQNLEASNLQTDRQIKDYENAYDLKETEEIETVAGRLRTALDQPFYKALLRNEYKAFIDEYVEKAGRQLQRLKRHKTHKLKELVYTDVRDAVRHLLDEWEQLFRNLSDVRVRLVQTTGKRATEHDDDTDPTKQYVLASKAVKEQWWNDVSGAVTRRQSVIPDGIARELYVGQFRRYCAKHRPGGQYTEQTIGSAEALFHHTVVRWCRETLHEEGVFNRNLIEALRKEAEYAAAPGQATSPDAHIETRVRALGNLANPWIPQVKEPRALAAWGLHPVVRDALRPQQREEWFRNANRVDSEGFSRYELIHYVSNYGLLAEDFKKFYAGSTEVGAPQTGGYYTAYHDLVGQMMRDPKLYVTPHLDRRWHLPAYLPFLSADEQQRFERRRHDALLLGLVYGLLTPTMHDQRAVWTFNPDPTKNADTAPDARSLDIDGAFVDARLHLLYEALNHHPDVVDDVLERARAFQDEDFKAYPKDNTERYHRFYQGVKELPASVRKAATSYRDTAARGKAPHNLLDSLLLIPNAVHGNASLEHVSNTLQDRLLTLVQDYYLAFYQTENTAIKYATNFIERLKQESVVLQSAR